MRTKLSILAVLVDVFRDAGVGRLPVQGAGVDDLGVVHNALGAVNVDALGAEEVDVTWCRRGGCIWTGQCHGCG